MNQDDPERDATTDERDDPSDHQTAAMTHRIVSVEFSLWASMANITSRRL